MGKYHRLLAGAGILFLTGCGEAVTSPVEMLMCGKVTKRLNRQQPLLFRKLCENE